MVAWVGYTQVPIDYRRGERKAGRGASYRALLRLAFEAVTSFSDVPLALASWFGIVTATLSAVAATTILILAAAKALAISIGIWILIAVLFLGGVQLIGIGILGRYLARVHDQVLGRPLYVVARVLARDGRSR
jgi:dolichol-phosphate mannosyltransferase